jgi:hypothetical protein
MDAATLFLVLVINGKEREEHPRVFPNVTACEAHVADLKSKIAQYPFPAEVARYDCMRWYAIAK